jgi:microcin C transport system substrate-binding protein
MRHRHALTLLLTFAAIWLGSAAGVLASDQAATAYNWRHAVALHGEPRYPADFKQLEYVNPNAPKGGVIKLAALQTFDNLNPYILKGVAAVGSTLPFETLMERSADEAFSVYGVLAESIAVASDRSWVAFKLRPQARFHDGSPVTAADVVFSFKLLLDKGHPSYKLLYRDVRSVKALDSMTVRFDFKDGSNRQLPLQVGELPILSEKFWRGKDFSATTLQPILGSGAYRIAQVDAGRSITYERVKDWWGANLPLNRGRYNYDQIRFDYYRDETVQLEAFLAGRYDVRQEATAKLWSTAYRSPHLATGALVKQELPNQLPTGMQAFVLNTRRPQFQDPRVREAMDWAFDFEWSNKTIAFGAYQRTNSFFNNTELAATGLPDAAELKLLEPYRGKIPDEVFSKIYASPKTDGSGNPRENLRRASDLLSAAGWMLKDGKLVDAAGKPFSFVVLDQNTRFERWLQPYFRNLERLGIKPQLRVVDTAQYQNLVNAYDFDVITSVFPQSLSPGLEQRDFWSSANTDVVGGNNLIGIKDPVIDALVEGVIAADDRQDLITHARALDRVLLWHRFVVPQWYIGTYRLAYWNKFGQPSVAPKYGLGYLDQWWIEPEKAKVLPAMTRP